MYTYGYWHLSKFVQKYFRGLENKANTNFHISTSIDKETDNANDDTYVDI